jgi:hypothetical protein
VKSQSQFTTRQGLAMLGIITTIAIVIVLLNIRFLLPCVRTVRKVLGMF